MNPIQSNTQRGIIVRNYATSALTGKRGYLAKLVDATGEAVVALPTADGQLCPFVIDDEGLPTVIQNKSSTGISSGSGTGTSGVSLMPLEPGRNVRLIATTTIAGGVVVMAESGGKIKTAVGSTNVWTVGVTEEDGVAGQYVLVRPFCTYIQASGGSGL